MQLTSFISYLKEPSSISNENEINAIVNEFPYCQTGQLMYAYQLKKNNNILFDEQLKKAATYCTDRKRLFEQLHNETIAVEKIEVAEQIAPEQNIEHDSEEQNPVIKKDTELIIEDTENQAPPLVEEKTDLENTSVEEGKKPLDELEKNYLGAAISSTILLETEVDEPSIPKENPIIEEETTNFDTDSPHSFSDWLKHYNTNKEVPKSVVKEKKTNRSIDLIDKFIQEDPKIEPKKSKFYSPVNMARLSVVNDSELVSETLALIHVDQGNFTEAINAYEKLSLKNPEKRSYFADQIKILKQKIK